MMTMTTETTSISLVRLTRSQWSRAVRASSLLTRHERSFAVDLATLMDADGRLCHPRAKIARRLGTSPSGIDRLRHRLVEVGLLINTLPGYSGQTAEYVAVDPKSASLLTRFFASAKEQRDIFAMTDGVSDECFEAALDAARAEDDLSRANVIRKIRKLKGEARTPSGSSPRIQARESVTSDAQSVGKSASLHDALSGSESASLVTHQYLSTYVTETSTVTTKPKPPSPVLSLLRRSDPAPDVTGGSKEEPGPTRRPSPTSPGDWSWQPAASAGRAG